MVNSVHGELRKPSTAAAETTAIASNLRAKKQRSCKRKNTKLAPIGTKSSWYPGRVSEIN
jgi:hypothetical protein